MRTSRPWLRGGSDLILDRLLTWFGSIPGPRSRILTTAEVRACDDSIGATGARAMVEGRSPDVGTRSEIPDFQIYARLCLDGCRGAAEPTSGWRFKQVAGQFPNTIAAGRSRGSPLLE